MIVSVKFATTKLNVLPLDVMRMRIRGYIYGLSLQDIWEKARNNIFWNGSSDNVLSNKNAGAGGNVTQWVQTNR